MRPVALLLLSVLLCACADEIDLIADLTTRVDTVGATVVVEHTGRPRMSRLEPLLTLGVRGTALNEPTPEEFGRVESVISDASGHLYVADGLALEVRVFNEEGRFLRRIGRRGQGPGEFEGLHGIAWLAGDTLVAMDYGNARLTLFRSSGQVVGQWHWLRLTGSVRFLFNGGSREIYAHTFRQSPAAAGLASRGTWVRYAPAGPTDSLDIPQAEPRSGTGTVCRGDGIGFFENPYGDRFLRVPGPGGERLIAWASQYRIALVGSAGDTLRVISRDVARSELSDSTWSVVEARYTEYREDWKGADCEGDVTRPRYQPVLMDAFFDHDGRLMVEYAEGDQAAIDVFGRDGRWVLSFPVPAERDRSVPPFLRDTMLSLVTKDSLDVQHVWSFRVVPELR